MAPLHFPSIKPRASISARATIPPLRNALHYIGTQCTPQVWLVGGTALAGYYAEHRRSDDLDLFVPDVIVHDMTVRAVKSLSTIGAALLNERRSALYYHTDVQLKGSTFTIDVVIDEYLHRIGHAVPVSEGVSVVDLPTLFGMKAACLISRCSEKDLYDLDYLLRQAPGWRIEEVIASGLQFDGGLTTETLLIGLKGARLRKEACQFLLPNVPVTATEVFRKITNLQRQLLQRLLDYERGLLPPPEVKTIAHAVKTSKKLRE